MQGRRSRPNFCWSPLRLLPLALCLYKKIKRSFFNIVNKLQILELCDKHHIDTLTFWILKEGFCLEQFKWIFFIFFTFFNLDQVHLSWYIIPIVECPVWYSKFCEELKTRPQTPLGVCNGVTAIIPWANQCRKSKWIRSYAFDIIIYYFVGPNNPL